MSHSLLKAAEAGDVAKVKDLLALQRVFR